MTEEDYQNERAEGSVTLTIEDASKEAVAKILAGLGVLQLEYVSHGEIEETEVAAAVFFKIAEQNPAVVREALLDHREEFRGTLPDELEDMLDLEVSDAGRIQRPDDDSEWQDVGIE